MDGWLMIEWVRHQQRESVIWLSFKSCSRQIRLLKLRERIYAPQNLFKVQKSHASTLELEETQEDFQMC